MIRPNSSPLGVADDFGDCYIQCHVI